MKVQILFSVKNKKNITNLSYTKLAQRVIKVNPYRLNLEISRWHILKYFRYLQKALLKFFFLLARLDKVQEELLHTTGVSIHIYVKVFLRAYFFQTIR